MPEMTMVVRWPDGIERDYYSPSLVVHHHLTEGDLYTVADFRDRATRALGVASDRVRATYGFACTSAAASTDRIHRAAAAFGSDDLVEVVRLWPPLPEEER